MKTMYLDDIRTPANKFDFIARSSDEAKAIVHAYGCPSFISFDHDLGEDDTAMVFIHWLINRDLDNPGTIPADFSFNIHSANPVGRDNIQSLLNSYIKSKL